MTTPSAQNNLVEKLKRQINAKSITGILVFGAIILVFVFFGMQGGTLGMGIGNAGRVNDTFISVAEFQRQQSRTEQYYSSLFGGSMDFSSQRQLLAQQAIEQLIMGELVAQLAQKQGILVTDAEVQNDIVYRLPYFQQEGRFVRELYSQLLEANRLTPIEFERGLRQEKLNVRSRLMIDLASRPSKIEATKLRELKGAKINVQFLKIDQEAATKKLGAEKLATVEKDLETALSEGNEAKVTSLAQELGAGWEETGSVDLAAEVLPKLQSPVVNEAVGELTNQKPLLGRVVRDGAFKYVLKLKQMELGAPAVGLEKGVTEMLRRRRAEGVYNSWVYAYRAQSRVEINPQIFQR